MSEQIAIVLEQNANEPWYERAPFPVDRFEQTTDEKAPRFLTVVNHAPDDLVGTLQQLGCEPADWGVFTTTGNFPLTDEKRALRGLLVGLTDCTDDARLDEFNAWYDDVHAADVIRSPWYWRGRRFRRSAGTLPEYLALYDTESTEPNAFQQYFEWPERDRTRCDVCAIRHVWTFNHVSSHEGT